VSTARPNAQPAPPRSPAASLAGARLSILLAVVAALLAAALLGACGSEPTGGGTGFAGYWQSAPSSKLGGTLLIRIEQSDGQSGGATITGLSFLGSAGDRGTREGTVLVVHGQGARNRDYEARFTLGPGTDKLTITLLRTGKSQAQSAAPVLTLPMVRASGSDAQLAAALAAQQQHVLILKVEQSTNTLRAGIERWAQHHHGVYPPPGLAKPGAAFAQSLTAGAQHAAWPVNPYTGHAMLPGSGAGQYTYSPTPDRKSYTLAAHFSEGADYVVP
jgi:hypothetical protein